MLEKFKTFRWVDFISFMIPISMVGGFTVYTATQGITGEALALMSTVTLSMVAIYGLFLFFRKQFIDRITFITKHQIAVITNEFTINKEEFEKEVDETIAAWSEATKWPGCEKALEGVFVFFKPYPVQLHSTPGNFAGYLIGDTAVIGYKEDLDKTALAHELGHRIHTKWTIFPDLEKSHKFMRENKLR